MPTLDGISGHWGFNMNNNNIVDITGLDPAEVLAALYNASKPMGKGFFNYDPKPMTVGEANQLMLSMKYFDYIYDRVIKIGITSESKEIDVLLYNRDNGENAGQDVILDLRTKPLSK